MAPPVGSVFVNNLRDLLGRCDTLPVSAGFDPMVYDAFDPKRFEEEHSRQVDLLPGGHWKCPYCGKHVPKGLNVCPDKDCGAVLVRNRGEDRVFLPSMTYIHPGPRTRRAAA
jgi:predicted nucleic acid-binding Zn ribbon protein